MTVTGSDHRAILCPVIIIIPALSTGVGVLLCKSSGRAGEDFIAFLFERVFYDPARQRKTIQSRNHFMRGKSTFSYCLPPEEIIYSLFILHGPSGLGNRIEWIGMIHLFAASQFGFPACVLQLLTGCLLYILCVPTKIRHLGKQETPSEGLTFGPAGSGAPARNAPAFVALLNPVTDHWR